MGLKEIFSKKQVSAKEALNKFASGEAKKILIGDFTKAIQKAYEGKRIIFNNDGTITYKEYLSKNPKEGFSSLTKTVDELAQYLFNKNINSDYKMAAIATAGFTQEDVKNILLKIKDGGKK